MRLFLISLGIAAISLIPFSAGQFLLDIPLALSIVLLPLAEGLHYMAVLFHESGHAITHWLFGTPALPMIDTVHGGGVTYSYGRSMAVLAGVYALMSAGVLLLLYARKWRAAAVLAGFIAFHGIFVWRGWGMPLGVFMGHGTESIVACWCIWRASDLKSGHSLAERYVSMITGLHLAGRVLLLSAALMLHDMRRLSYSVQKGKRGSADLDVFAKLTGISMETAAALLALFFAICLVLTLGLLYKRSRTGA